MVVDDEKDKAPLPSPSEAGTSSSGYTSLHPPRHTRDISTSTNVSGATLFDASEKQQDHECGKGKKKGKDDMKTPEDPEKHIKFGAEDDRHDHEHAAHGTEPLATQASRGSAAPRSRRGSGARSRPSSRGTRDEMEGDAAHFIEEVLAGPLRNLGSRPSQWSLRSGTTRSVRSGAGTPMGDQRHPGKEGVYISRSTRMWVPPPPVPPIPTEHNGANAGGPPVPPTDGAADIVQATGDGALAAEDEYFVHGFALYCLVIGLMLAVFLISIDRTIISTAIPYITAEFKSTTDIGWYGSAYLLTACAFQPLFGRIFMLFSVKISYLIALFFFELGSLLCGVAPDSITLIIGRAIAGFGSAGILTGSFVVVGTAIPLEVRPIYTAVVGVMFGVGATVGPLLGGVFTDLATWRWCFYVNLPIGGVTGLAMILFFHPKQITHAHRTFLDRALDLDTVGNILLLGASIMLFLALEYTTQGISWDSSVVIGLMVGFGLTAILFTAWQWREQDAALLPPRIVTQRTVAASCGMAFMTYAALINLTYFLPIWFQAIKGESAIESGVDMIPYFVVNAVFSVLAGIFVTAVGYATPPAVLGSAIGTIGLGLLTLLNVDTTTAQWVGYEILSSAGFGLSIQQGFTAVQTVLHPDDIAIGTACVVASQSLGGAIFLSAGNSVFQRRLQKASEQNLLPGIDITAVINAGATAFRNLVPAAELPGLLQVYNKALTDVFTVSIPLGALAVVICCFIEFKSVKAIKRADDLVNPNATVETRETERLT